MINTKQLTDADTREYLMTPYLIERADITTRVKEMMIRQMNLQLTPCQIDNDAPLFGAGLGLDSIDALELIVGLEQEFGVAVREDQNSIFRSVNTIVDFIMSNPE